MLTGMLWMSMALATSESVPASDSLRASFPIDTHLLEPSATNFVSCTWFTVTRTILPFESFRGLW